MTKIREAAIKYISRQPQVNKYGLVKAYGIFPEGFSIRVVEGSVSNKTILTSKDGKSHPYRGPVWYPTPLETRDCCRKVKPPTSFYPHNYLEHCRSMKHISYLYDVDYAKLRDEVRVMKEPEGFGRAIMRIKINERIRSKR